MTILYKRSMKIKELLHQFPQRIYRSLLSFIGFSVLWYIYFSHRSHTSLWSTYQINGTYSFTTTWVLSWSISWTYSWYVFGSWVYSIQVRGEWTLWNDTLVFTDMNTINSWSDMYFHYWPIQYISSTQTGLSQLLHQYIRLGDSYEKKRYRFTSSSLIDSTIEMAKTHLTRKHASRSWLFSTQWTYTITSKSSLKNRTIQWNIEYTRKELWNIIIELPQKTIDGSVFIDAFIGSWFTELE